MPAGETFQFMFAWNRLHWEMGLEEGARRFAQADFDSERARQFFEAEDEIHFGTENILITELHCSAKRDITVMHNNAELNWPRFAHGMKTGKHLRHRSCRDFPGFPAGQETIAEKLGNPASSLFHQPPPFLDPCSHVDRKLIRGQRLAELNKTFDVDDEQPGLSILQLQNGRIPARSRGEIGMHIPRLPKPKHGAHDGEAVAIPQPDGVENALIVQIGGIHGAQIDQPKL